MIKIIAQKSTTLHYFYKTIFENISDNSICQLSLLIRILESDELNRVKNDIMPEFTSAWLIVFYGAYYDNYYIAFYDPFFDSFWEKICEKKYGKKSFILDDETPMLRFSKENFDHLVVFWQTVKNNKPEYYIITQNDKGWIDVQSKDKLSSEETLQVEEYAKNQEKLHAKNE